MRRCLACQSPTRLRRCARKAAAEAAALAGLNHLGVREDDAAVSAPVGGKTAPEENSALGVEDPHAAGNEQWAVRRRARLGWLLPLDSPGVLASEVIAQAPPS